MLLELAQICTADFPQDVKKAYHMFNRRTQVKITAFLTLIDLQEITHAVRLKLVMVQ